MLEGLTETDPPDAIDRLPGVISAYPAFEKVETDSTTVALGATLFMLLEKIGGGIGYGVARNVIDCSVNAPARLVTRSVYV